MLALLLAVLAVAADARPAYSPKRLALVRSVTAVDAAPGGETAYFVTDATGDLELWSVPAGGGWPVQLTDLGQQVIEPVVSPDGKTVVFASDYGGDERPDLFLVPAEGGEAVNLTVSTRAENSPVFSPDGKKLAYTADPVAPFLFQLFVRDLDTGKEVRLTDEPENVHFPVWSPDGKVVAATRSGDDRSGPLLLAWADGSGTRVIAPPVKGGILIPETWSPDGRALLCFAEDPDGFRRMYLLNTLTGQGRFIGPAGWDVEQVAWKKGSGLVYARNEAGATGLYRMADADAAPERLLPSAGRVEDFALTADGKTAFLVWSDSSHAPDVWRLDLATKEKAQVTRSMLGGVKAEELAPGRVISYTSFDGKKVSAVYIAPRENRLGTPPPLVVMVHGGPDWQSFDDFHPMRQSLAEAGFAVLAPNFRGSTGFGRAFLEANRKDWGGGDRKDLIAGVEHLARNGAIDPKRVGITGGSFGGYMTLYALARNEGTWRAGVAAYGMPDLALDYELAKTRFQDWYEVQMGNPVKDAALFKERSAITYIADLKAPLLVFQGANDTNVLEAQARLVHDRLKALGRAPGLVIYPDEGHGFTRRKNLADYYTRTVEFFRKELH
ncbi:MAG: S9 family peptidase [Elusimicrobiota bacterium]|nr:S9 family peptidase [Elusimicrobiota bacterium]